MIKKIFFHLKTLNKYRKFRNFIKLNIVRDRVDTDQRNKKDIILFEFINMCSTHIAYLNIIQPLISIYKSTPYGISTGLSSNTKIKLYNFLDFFNLFHFGIYNAFWKKYAETIFMFNDNLFYD